MPLNLQKSARSLLANGVISLFVFILAVSFLNDSWLHAADLSWDANGSSAGQTDGGGGWLDANRWWDGAGNASWTSGDAASFGHGGSGGSVSLASPTTVDALTFNAFTGTYTLGTSGQVLTINSGIDMTSDSAAVTFAGPITLGGSQTWTNNSSGELSTGSVTNLIDNGGHQLSIDGSGTTSLGQAGSANVTLTGSGALVKSGSGRLNVGGLNSGFTGTVTINGGQLHMYNNAAGLGSGNVTLNGGVLSFYWSTNYNRTLGTGDNQVQLIGGESGFGGAGKFGPSVNLGGTIIWGANGEGSATGFFNPSKFVLGDPESRTSSSSSLSNGIDLNGATRIIKVPFGASASANVSKIFGVIQNSTGTAGLIKEGGGTLVLASANTYNGDTTIEAGTLQMDNLNSLGSNIQTLTINGGLLNLNNKGDLTVGNLTGTGGIIANNGADNRTLTIGSGDATGGNSQGAIADTTAADSGTLSLTKTGTGTMTLSGTNTYTGATTISAGTLQVGAGGTTGSLATSAVTNNATLIYDRSDDFSVGYTISGSGAFIKQGAGVMTFSSPSIQSAHITISEGVLQFDQANMGNQAAAMTIAETGATLDLNFSGTQALDVLYIGETEMPSGVYKAIGSPAEGTELAQITGPGTLSATGDVYPPTVVSITSDIDTYAVASGTAVTYTITFNEAMDSSTVSSDDFANAGSAPITIGAITETSPGVFTVVVTATGAGTLQLAIPAGATLSDLAGNALDTSSTVVLEEGTVPVYVASSGLPEFVAASPVATNDGASITMEMPAGAAPGDVLVAFVVNYTAGIPSDVIHAGTDWVYEKGKFMAGEYSDRIKFFSREVKEGDGPTFTLGLGSIGPYSAGGVILAFRNMDKTDNNWAPFAGGGPSIINSESTPSTSASEAPLVYVNRADSLVVLLGVAVTDTAVNWSNWDFADSWNTFKIGAPDEILDASASTGTHTFSFGAANTIFEAPNGPTGSGMANLSEEAYSAMIQFQFKPLVNDSLYAALTALKAHVTGNATLSSSQIGNHIDTIVAGRFSFASSINSIAAAIDLVHTYDEVLGPLWVARNMPNRGNLQNDIHHAVFKVMQYLLTYSYNETNLAVHYDLLNNFAFGSSAHFPGECPPPEDPDAIHTVLIDADYPDTWGREVFGQNEPSPRPTGTYLAPGSVASITVPEALVGKGYRIRVGAHGWDMSEKTSIRRLDRCTKSYAINATTTLVANPLGGGIYIEVPKYRTGYGVVSVQIQNAARSPYFSAKSFHQTTLNEWQNIERNHPAPWADFQSEKFMMQVPTDWIYAMDDPVTLMADWDHAADILNDLMGFPRDRGRETIYNQVDLQLRAVAFTPGYPTANNTYNPNTNYGGYANNYLVRGPQYAPDFEFHELGHGYRFPKFPGEVESDVNLLHVPVFHGFGYSLDEAFRTSRGGSPTYATLETTAIAWMMCDNFLNGNIMEQFEKQYALKGHAKFVEIARLFGWDRLGDYFRSFNEDYENGITPVEEVDPLLLRLSKETGIDMRPLFHFWGVPPVDASALDSSIQAANLPKSALIYDTLVNYKSLIPADNATFRTFASNWWGGQPSIDGFSEERNHADRWVNYDAAMAGATANQAQAIIDLYFPTGRPSDYGDWRSEWAKANLLDPQADLDGDGMSNEDERIWGLDPTKATSRNPIQFDASLNTGSFAYTRRDPALTGHNYSVWTSTNLADWDEDTGAQQIPGDPDENGVQSVETILSPELLDEPTLFIQMRSSE